MSKLSMQSTASATSTSLTGFWTASESVLKCRCAMARRPNEGCHLPEPSPPLCSVFAAAAWRLTVRLRNLVFIKKGLPFVLPRKTLPLSSPKTGAESLKKAGIENPADHFQNKKIHATETFPLCFFLCFSPLFLPFVFPPLFFPGQWPRTDADRPATRAS